MKHPGNIFTVIWVPGYHPRYLTLAGQSVLVSEKKNAFLGNSPFEIPMVAYPFLRLMVPVAKKTGLLGWAEDTALSVAAGPGINCETLIVLEN